MKIKLIAAFVLLLSNLMVSAQLSGEVQYTTKINMHKNIPDTERGKRMKQFVPEFMDFKNTLLFTATETVYKNVPDEDEGVEMDEDQRRQSWMKKRMAPANDIVYTNVETNEVVEKKEFMDKVFLIEDSIVAAKWKLTGEMKEVSGMNCMKAEYVPAANDSTDTLQMYVWFTPEIAVSSGPAGYGGLPGLIVYLNENDGTKEISLSTIVMREIKKEEIEEPKKGKKVTREEYHEIVRKKMEEQRKQWEGQKGGHWH
ncbi:GLPGLI family protein [Paracrocinitomix mangrovi]|uniref:GLPGLI family protein n=1 Tax=Paracrocinitomix mangrovi TaxID=2862509 RepID=UPI001C8E69F5|nr:GLPGLI family protein [Paracrocinitomix mangrovi]UKN03751.1 GLPGLI family protein [Paracrocinitomix mangrovi]